jgi:hypothetical protein
MVAMETIDFPFKAIETLTFTARPQTVPASLRPVYRIALIVAVLKTNCRGNTASFLKIQFFNWVLKSLSLQEVIEDRLTRQSVFTLELIHLDPMVNLALKYAVADKIISVTNSSKYKLTETGCEFADRILQDKQSILAEELKLLMRIGQGVSEVKLRQELI